MGPEPMMKSALFLSPVLSWAIRGSGHAKGAGERVTI